MNTLTNDGGPAFPHMGNTTYSGMTLRDWFAGQFLSGYVMSAYTGTEPNYIANSAYEHADAMIAAKNQTKP